MKEREQKRQEKKTFNQFVSSKGIRGGCTFFASPKLNNPNNTTIKTTDRRMFFLLLFKENKKERVGNKTKRQNRSCEGSQIKNKKKTRVYNHICKLTIRPSANGNFCLHGFWEILNRFFADPLDDVGTISTSALFLSTRKFAK